MTKEQKATRADAEAALETLKELLPKDLDPKSRSVALSLIMSAALGIKAPLYVFASPVAGSGMGYFFDAVKLIVEGGKK